MLGRVCITTAAVTRTLTTQPPFGTFFALGKKILVAAVATPASQVSRTSTSVSSGSAGFGRTQIQRLVFAGGVIGLNVVEIMIKLLQ